MTTLKKSFLTVAACFLVSIAFAQDKVVQSNDVKQKVEQRVSTLKQQLTLTEDQTATVSELAYAIEQKKAAGSDKAETLEMMFNEQLANILTEEQMTKYQEMQLQEREKGSK